MIRFLSRISFIIIVILAQLLVLNNIHIIGYTTPMLYVMLILMFKPDTSREWVLIAGFCLGLLMDTFTNTQGVAAASTTLLAAIQPHMLKLFAPSDSEPDVTPSYHDMGSGAFIRYVLLCVLCHHTTFYALESFSLFDITTLLINIAGSTLISTVLILIIQCLRK